MPSGSREGPTSNQARSEKLHAGYRQKRVHGISTAVVRFDGAVYFVPRYAVHRPVALTLLQLDVEGFERAVLEGARETIVRDQQVIVLEDNRAGCGELIAELGYSPARWHGNDHLYLTESARREL